MGKGTPFFAGLNKTQLTAAIRQEVGQVGFGHEFESVLISDLIAEKHYYCAGKGLRPARFRKVFRPGAAYDFEGFFPERGWHLVSWAQCISPRDELDWLKRALRDAVQPIVARYRAQHPTCEICNAPSAHVDHVEPEFDELATRAIAALGPSEVETVFARFDWWSKEPFSLGESNPAVQFILDAHETALLRAVCQPCHLVSASQRRAARRP